MAFRFAFMGFRHGHILSLHDLARQREDTEVVACCEEDADARETLAVTGDVTITHQDYETMLREVDCDAVAVGDYYGKRGGILIRALKAGKHVIADKPLCTRLSELEEIESLAASRKLSVGCMLDLRSLKQYRQLREMVLTGEIGEVHAVSFEGQHPLSHGSRPQWYFEEGKHGGTLNDIAIHAVDYIPWATGMKFTTVKAARNWNASLKQIPWFKDAAQVMLTMENGGGVLGDVSYLTPDNLSYTLPQYWRMTFWGHKGMLETNAIAEGVLLCRTGSKEAQVIQSGEPRAGSYLEDFLKEVRQEGETVELKTTDVIESSRVALRVQEAADEGLYNVPV